MSILSSFEIDVRCFEFSGPCPRRHLKLNHTTCMSIGSIRKYDEKGYIPVENDIGECPLF